MAEAYRHTSGEPAQIGIDPAQYGTVDTTAVGRYVSGLRQGMATFRLRKPGKRYDVSAKSLMRRQLRRMGHGR